MSQSWIEKYTPKKIEDICYNKRSIYEIINWLNEFELIKQKKKLNDTSKNNKIIQKKKKLTETSESSCTTKQKKKYLATNKANLLITGNHGSGKTCHTTIILNNLNYDIINLEMYLNSNRNIQEIINKLIYGKNIINMIKHTRKNQVLLIDEIETITSQTDKKFILNLIKLNELNFFLPIIFISNNQHNKLISEIKKKSNQIKFLNPENLDMFNIANIIITSENIQLENEYVLDIILDYAQFDIRRLVIILQDLNIIFGKVFNFNNIKQYIDNNGKKDITHELFNITKYLLYDYEGISQGFKYYETDKVLIPLMISQNHTNVININKNLEEVCEINEMISKGDVIENYIYGNQIWDLQNIHGLYTCVYPSFRLNKITLKNKNGRINFTTDLNKTSIKNINKKNITCISKYVNNITITDIIYINKIIKKMLFDKKYDELIQILNEHKIKIDGYESLLKIDKIDETKIILSYKKKKYIISQLK